MDRKVLVGVGVLAGLAALFALSLGAPTAAGPHGDALFEVKRADLDITLTEDGTLVAKESKKLTFRSRRGGRITFLVPEGNEVEEGEVVCKLDATDLQKRLEETELSLLSAETTLNTARTDLEIQKADNVTNIEKAENAAMKAKKDLERYRDGDAPQELRKLQVALKDAETTLNRTQKKYGDSVKLVELEYIRQTELDDHKIEFDKARINKEGADLAIRLFETYTRPMTMSEKVIAVRDTRRGLDTTKKRSESKLLQKQVAVTQAEKRIKRHTRQIKEFKGDIEHFSLKAPVPGVVIYGDPRNPRYAERVKIGGNMWSGLTVMTIPDLRVMLVKVEIHEADINKVAVGHKAKVTFDTYPGLVPDAEVTKIAQIAGGSTPPWQGQSSVKRFDVEITIKGDPKIKLKPGISAKVEIFIDRRKHVLFVPVQCVFLEHGKHYCHVANGSDIVRRDVSIGLSNENYTEILAGLEEGEKLLLYNPDLPAGTGVKPDEKGKPAARPTQKGAPRVSEAARPSG